MKRAALFLVPVLLVALVASWIALRAPWRVRYQGRPLADLLAREEPEDVSKAVASLGLPALPVLLEALQPRTGFLQKLGLERPDPRLLVRSRVTALLLLGDWGPEAQAALPSLLGAAKADAPAWELALLAAAKMSPQSRDVCDRLVARLTSQPESRARAALVIYRAGLSDPRFVQPLSGALKDIRVGRPLDRLPVNEILALSRQGAAAAAAVPSLVSGWEIEELRGIILAALLEFGPQAAAAVPLLTEALEDDRNRPLWPEILHVLASIGPPAEPAATSVADRLESRDPLVRGMAAVAAASIRRSPNFAVTALVEQLQNTNYAHARAILPLRVGDNRPGLGHREAAAWFLGEIGPAAAEALPALRSMQRESNLWLRLFSARAIWRISGDIQPSLAAIGAELGADNEASGIWVCQLAGEIGPAAKGLTPQLQKAMTRNLKLRAAAWDALEKISAR